MRKLFIILFVAMCLPVAQAQQVWASADGRSHYMDVEFSLSPSSPKPILLTSAHQPSLTYIAMLVDTYREKLRSGEWKIWVESYVHTEGKTIVQNRNLAKVLSNTVKSHMICNNLLSEDDFTTRNYSGTLSGRQAIVTVIIGSRYPLEKILSEQKIDWEYDDLQWLTNMAKSDSSVQVDFNDVSKVIPGMDTTKIYSPYFEPITFSYQPLRPAKKDSLKVSNVDLKAPTSSISSEPTTNQYIADHDSLTTALVAPLITREKLNEKIHAKKLTPEERKARQEQKLKQKQIQADLQNKVDKVRTENTLNESTAVISGQAKLGQSTSKNQMLDVSAFAFDESLARSQIDAVYGKNTTVAAKTKDQSTQQTGKVPIASATGPQIDNSGAIQIVPPALSPTPKVVETTDASTLATKGLYNKNNRVRKIKKSEREPSVKFDADGRMSIDATGISRALSAENLIKINEEQRTTEQAEKRAVRVRESNQRVAQLKEIQKAKGRFAVFGVGINALTTLVLKPGIELDAYFSDRFSAVVEGYYSKWNYSKNNKFNVSLISPELRFYATGRRKAFDGLYVGLYGSIGSYNKRQDSRIGSQSDFWSAGISVGYVLPIGKSGFYLDAGISAGYVNENIDKYIFHQGDNFRIDSFNRVSPFLPTKIKVSFVYRIFNQKKTIKSEN